MNGERPEDRANGLLRPMPTHVLEHVEERQCGGGLVAVHLRPEQNVEWPVAEPEVVDRPAFDRAADLLEGEEIWGVVVHLLQAHLDLRVAHQRR